MPQTTVESEIRSRVVQFTEELANLVREAALEAVSAALGDGGRVSAPRRGRKKAARRARSSGGDISDAVLSHVRSNPGCRAEEIMNALGQSSDDVKRALVSLKTSGAIKARGKARGTNYVVGGRGASPSGRATKKRGRRGKRGARKAERKRKSKPASQAAGLVW